MGRFIYTGKEKQRFAIPGLIGTVIPNSEIEIPDSKIALMRQIFPKKFKAAKKKDK